MRQHINEQIGNDLIGGYFSVFLRAPPVSHDTGSTLRVFEFETLPAPVRSNQWPSASHKSLFGDLPFTPLLANRMTGKLSTKKLNDVVIDIHYPVLPPSATYVQVRGKNRFEFEVGTPPPGYVAP